MSTGCHQCCPLSERISNKVLGALIQGADISYSSLQMCVCVQSEASSCSAELLFTDWQTLMVTREIIWGWIHCAPTRHSFFSMKHTSGNLKEITDPQITCQNGSMKQRVGQKVSGATAQWKTGWSGWSWCDCTDSKPAGRGPLRAWMSPDKAQIFTWGTQTLSLQPDCSQRDMYQI